MKKYLKKWAFALIILPFVSCGQQTAEKQAKHNEVKRKDIMKERTATADTATFAAGCFWCVEEQFKQLDGVLSVTSGYTGGHTKNPTYREVSTGTTGHAEACNIVYNPQKISYAGLLEAFFVAHDPTQLNRQGNDVGTQYRSAIFYHNETQKKMATDIINELNLEGAYPAKIVTEVNSYDKFYTAEDYHQEYYENNPEAAYCQFVIKPKREKFRKVFKDKLKK